MEKITKNTVIFLGKWFTIAKRFKIALLIISIFSFMSGYLLSPMRVKIIEIEKFSGFVKKITEGNEERRIYEKDGIRIEIRQRVCCIKVLDQKASIITEVWIFSDIFNIGHDLQKTFVTTGIKFKKISEKKESEMAKAIKLSDKLKISLNI